jgi:hypothetical protein
MTPLAHVLVAAFTLGLSLLPATSHVQAQGRKTFVGTWAYNAKASTPTANTYKYRRIVISEAGTGLAFSIEEALADGPDLRWGFTTKGDGTPAPVTGIGAIDTVIANIEARSGIVEYRKGPAVMTRSLIEASENGAVLTITSSRTMSDGTTVKARTQYDRQ